LNKIIKNILNKIESKGYQAFLVGGYVRDMLMGINSYDIDICSDATPRELMKIFPNAGTNIGGINFKIKEYNVEVMTYREEIKYKDRKPLVFNYVDSLRVDLKRRDFTVNAICMNLQGELIDELNGLNDIKNQKIRIIGDADTKIKEDPLRILRAIRFATILNFNIDSFLYKNMKKNYKLVLELSGMRIKEELDKILLSSNVKRGLKLMDEVGISKILNIKYEDFVVVSNIDMMYAQISIGYDLPFTKASKDNIKSLKEIVNKGEINFDILYNYGLYLSTIAGEVLGISSVEINKMYKNMPIKDKKDINIRSKDIINILEIKPSPVIGKVLVKLESLILKGIIKNKRSELIKYVKVNKERWQ